MTVDPHTYAFAEAWGKRSGWHNTIDADRLAQRIQDTIEDFEADLINEEIRHD